MTSVGSAGSLSGAKLSSEGPEVAVHPPEYGPRSSELVGRGARLAHLLHDSDFANAKPPQLRAHVQLRVHEIDAVADHQLVGIGAVEPADSAVDVVQRKTEIGACHVQEHV